MRNAFQSLLVAGCLSALAALPDTVLAKDFPQRSQIDVRSRSEGLGRADVPLLKRVPGPGAEAAAAAVLKKLESRSDRITTRGERKKETQKGRVAFRSKDWSLEVVGDGTRINYRNHGGLESALKNARPVAARLRDDELEKRGRRFIAETLGLAQGQSGEIQPLYTEFQVVGGGPTNGGRPEEDRVVANTVVFTRTIDGIPVVGGGSKIAVTFLNDGTPVAFDYDWPTYQKTARRQKVLPVNQVRERSKKAAVVDLDAENVKLSRFECGLFDPGVQRRDAAAEVQSACYVQAVRRVIVDPEANRKDPNSGHVLVAIARAIPAGETIEPDKRWAEAEKLRGATSQAAPPSPPHGPSPRNPKP